MKRQLSSSWISRTLAAALVLLVAVLCPVSLGAQSRTKTLSGHVKDAQTGEPIIGAAVMVKATNIGSVTDLDGSYVLGISDPKAQIVASALGYKDQTIDVNGRAVIEIALQPDTESLEDAVVIGYGSQKKATVTGALATVETKELSRQASPQLSTSLGGVVPGVISRQVSGEPGYDSATLLIRGLGTWMSSSPLVLVDGVERDINLVNSDEIESFSILKDASATAVYGMRGANGVILINTKKGKVSRPKVTFRAEATNLHGLRFPEYIDAGDFATLMNEACTVSGYQIPWSDEEIEKFRDGSDPYNYPNVDWTDAVLKKNAFQTMDELSVSGGNETVRYYVAFGFSSQSGLFKEDPAYDYRTNSLSQRYNFRSNVDINITKNLIFGVGLSEVVQDRTYPGTDASTIFSSLKLVTPLSYPMINPDGSIGGASTSYEVNSPWRYVTQNGFAKQFRTTTQANASLKWDLGSLVTKGLSLEGNFSFDHYYFNEVFRRKTPLIKSYGGTDANGEDVYTVIAEETTMGYYIGGNSSNRAYYWDLRANYNRNFGKHNVGALLMFNRRDYKDLTASTSTLNLPYRRQGLAGRLNYNYDERYLAEVNFGYNGSENFAKGMRYGFFPAASLGWVITNEDFWHLDAVNHFKIRGSYGLVGNDANSADRFFYMSTINKTANGYYFGSSETYYNGMAELSMGSPSATWEVSHKADVGVDLEFLNGAVKIGADYFYEYRDGILIKRALIPDIMGAAWGDTPWANIGIMENQGFDGNIEISHTFRNGFYFDLRGNITYAHNTIIEDDTVYHEYSYQDSRGRSAGMFYGLTALGLFQSQEEIDNSPKQEFGTYTVGDIKYKDLNGDGVINNYDYSYIGYGRTPEIMYGFGLTMAWHGFDLSLNFSGAGHTNILLDSASMWPFYLDYPGYNVLTEYYNNRFIPGAEDNSNAKYPVVHAGTSSNNYTVNTLYMHNASYLKLKTAEFGYSIPKKLANKVKAESIRAFVNGNNLFSIDDVKIIDPETDNMGYSRYPTQRAITVGVQVGF